MPRAILAAMEKLLNERPGKVKTLHFRLAKTDDIIKAMNRGEVTIMVFADFSKAFDTVHFDIIIRKLYSMGFCAQFVRWIMSYLTEIQQYVQIDDKRSGKLNTNFGVPQGSILGPVLFNFYVADLTDHLGTMCTCHQYADDTTIYNSVKPKNLQMGVNQMNDSLKNLVVGPTHLSSP